MAPASRARPTIAAVIPAVLTVTSSTLYPLSRGLGHRTGAGVDQARGADTVEVLGRFWEAMGCSAGPSATDMDSTAGA